MTIIELSKDLPSTPELPMLVELLEKAANEVLSHEVESVLAELTILLADDNQLRDLNRQFLGYDEPTDVLSFPAEQIDPDTQTPYLGDVIISVERARQQAAAGGHELAAEIQLLAVHGILHLLGYDHAEAEDKEKMWAAQTEILRRLGVDLTPP